MDNTIHIIYDDRQSEDYGRLLGEFIEQGIDHYRFWNCIINSKSVVESINASHKTIVNWAKDHNKPYCIIAEQDVKFTSPTAWKYFLDNTPKTFDLYLSCTYARPFEDKNICGFHLYIVHQKFYDEFLSIPNDVHIDTYISSLKKDYHFCYPFPALQREGFSANNHAIVNYNTLLNPEDIYK